MIESTADQPRITFMFLSGGLAAGVVYLLARFVALFFILDGKYSKVVRFVSDFFLDFCSVAVMGAGYLFLTDRLNYGEIEFFTAISYLFGTAVAVFLGKKLFAPLSQVLVAFIRKKVKEIKLNTHKKLLFVKNNIKRREDERKRNEESKRARRESKRVLRQSLRQGLSKKQKVVARTAQRIQERKGQRVAFRL